MVGAQLAFKGLDVGARESDVSAMSLAAGIRLPDNELMIGGGNGIFELRISMNHVRVFADGIVAAITMSLWPNNKPISKMPPRSLANIPYPILLQSRTPSQGLRQMPFKLNAHY